MKLGLNKEMVEIEKPTISYDLKTKELKLVKVKDKETMTLILEESEQKNILSVLMAKYNK